MNKAIYYFFTEDHRRLEALLDRAAERGEQIDQDIYHAFRTGLLRHIKMEEKILFPAAQKANGGTPLPLAAKLRLDHGAITSLMVVPPTPALIRVLRHILDQHDLLEEQPGGMYEVCEQLTDGETEVLLSLLAATPAVPVQAFNPAGYALDAARRALARAGFDYDSLAQ